ncbi:helix-turn-helix domain-containing protein [Maridesulfovibrio frigidus]|uniref:hypothetical protein n=1 Tax=Maridesulfovibrio frigidus TaxID=340956 RepID=UPI0004E19118|nr:hypothetical protein [Maridesulfovibrio frigidus]
MKDFIGDGFPERLQQIIDSKEWNKGEFAKVGDVTGKSMSTYVGGTALPKAKTLANWGTFADISIDWLLLGRGEMYYSKRAKEELDPIIRRIHETRKVLEELGADPETIQQAILNITKSSGDELQENFAS